MLGLVAAGHTNAQIARLTWRVRGNRAHPPAEHPCQAAGVESHRRGHPRIPRPRHYVSTEAIAAVRLTSTAAGPPVGAGSGGSS
jgi:hypothetical protein